MVEPIVAHKRGYVLAGVCPFVCLFVCWQLRIKTTDWIFVRILPRMYLWMRKKIPLNFGNHSRWDHGNLKTVKTSTLSHCLLLTIANGCSPLPPLHAMVWIWLIDWVRLNVPPTHYRSYGDGFLRIEWPNQQCQNTEGTRSGSIYADDEVTVNPTVNKWTVCIQHCVMGICLRIGLDRGLRSPSAVVQKY